MYTCVVIINKAFKRRHNNRLIGRKIIRVTGLAKLDDIHPGQ